MKKILKIADKFLSKLNGGFILAYHQIEPDLFKKQIEILKPNIVISLNELIERKASRK